MPRLPRLADIDFELHGRRGVWIAWTVFLVGAAVVYAEKAANERSAFIRWRHQVQEFAQGTNIWESYYFPNPPIMPISLYPLMVLPPVVGAVAWFAIKALMASAAFLICFRMARGVSGRGLPWWAEGLIILLSLRPILSDLHHGNINILILFLIVASLAAWRKGYDVAAGLLMALAIVYKVTPALFLPYFVWKRSWRTAAATALGVGLFLVIVPGIVLGPQFNGQCLAMWWHKILRPYVVSNNIGDPEINQSMVGVVSRLLTEAKRGKYESQVDVNIVSLDPAHVARFTKGLSLVLVGLLAYLCRTRAPRRDDARMLGEFALVVLTMLFVSERSWKHHYVTMLLPNAYLVYRAVVAPGSRRLRRVLAGCLALSALLMLTTSDVGGLFADGQGHKIALGYGMFFLSGVVLYLAAAWRIYAERDLGLDALPATGPIPGRHLPAPHVAPASDRAPTAQD